MTGFLSLPSGFRAVAAALLFFLMIAPSWAYAQQPSDPNIDITGVWKGILQEKGLPQPVTLELETMVPGSGAGRLQYAIPRNCWIGFVYGGHISEGHIFYITPDHCGFDSEYSRGDHVKIRATESGGLYYEIVVQEAVKESAVLQAK